MTRDNPSLRGLLADPLIRLVMASDGVAEGDILDLARRHQAHRPMKTAQAAVHRRPDRDLCCQMMA